MSSTVVQVELETRLNKRTKRLHRVVVMLDNRQILSGERCNLDQALELVESADGAKHCKYCFGA